MHRALVLLLVLTLAGCGSVAPGDLPDPAGPPQSPPLTVKPAGQLNAEPVTTFKVRPPVKACPDAVGFDTLSRGARVAVLCGRAREVQVYDVKSGTKLGSVPAGIGPTSIASDLVDVFYVVDAVGESLLVFHQQPLELLRRVHLGGGPYAIAFDRKRWGLWITLNGANQLVNYAAGIRPVLRGTYPSIRDASSVSVYAGEVTVLGDDVQTLRPRAK